MPSWTDGAGLWTEAATLHYAGIHALDDVSVRCEPGRWTGLIGPNGAGKTTLVNALTGFAALTSGRVFLDGEDITGWSPQRRARAGLARTFQSARLFPELSVRENVEAAVLSRDGSRRAAVVEMQRILGLTGLRRVAEVRAAALPYAEQRAAGMARALGLAPRFLLLDEPAAGVDDLELAGFTALLRRIQQDSGCGVLLIEHNVDLVFDLAEEVIVLDHGAVIAHGAPADVRRDAQVHAAYLGVGGAR
ncbi:MAG: ABC transporter ATP-binding protein [Nocardioidaceae bacterium]|nr:ABC transporter ATP-binding protein [Nocardioidaceae bacterium]